MFTLKNPSYPEYIGEMSSGATCISFHPKRGNYAACGLHNGGVAVFNIVGPKYLPSHLSYVPNKHTGIVWQVKIFF